MDTLAAYEGSTEAGRMEGEGIYKYEDGTQYVGQFKNGAFHGDGLCGNQIGRQRHRRNVVPVTASARWRGASLVDGHTGEGKLIFANGEFRGIFNNGKHVDGQFVFSDGLVYVEDDWKYCTSADRRLHSEMKE